MEQFNLGFHAGMRVRAAALDFDPAQFWMEGIVTNYAITANELFFEVDLCSGIDTEHDFWSVTVAGEQGQEGPMGPQGPAGAARSIRRRTSRSARLARPRRPAGPKGPVGSGGSARPGWR